MVPPAASKADAAFFWTIARQVYALIFVFLAMVSVGVTGMPKFIRQIKRENIQWVVFLFRFRLWGYDFYRDQMRNTLESPYSLPNFPCMY